MERTYVIPLRKEFQKAPIYKRTKRAVSAARQFLQKHMKVENVKLGRHLNMKLWENGNRNPPHKVEVHAEIIKDKEGDYCYAELVGVKKEQLKFEKKAPKKEGLAGKLEELKGGDKKEETPKKEEEKKEKAEALKQPLKKEEAKPVVGSEPSVDAKKEDKQKVSQEKVVKRDLKKTDAMKK